MLIKLGCNANLMDEAVIEGLSSNNVMTAVIS